MTHQLIEALAATWSPDDLREYFQTLLRNFARHKRAGNLDQANHIKHKLRGILEMMEIQLDFRTIRALM